MASTTLLLPPRKGFAGIALPMSLARALGRGDHTTGEPGERAQLRRHFRLVPHHWPVAALTRQVDATDATDAAQARWLRIDPCHVRPDINGARLVAHGPMLGLTAEDAAALLPALRPLFGDAGFPIDAPTAARWYLRLPMESRLPGFAEPDAALGEDLFEHLPEGDAGRRWRALLGEAGIVLHHHPWNLRRAEAGRLAVNALWPWGSGVLPDSVATHHDVVRSDDVLLQGLAMQAGALGSAPDARPLVEINATGDSVLHDLRSLSPDRIVGDWLALLASRARGAGHPLTLDFADGAGLSLQPGQRWRVWRRPLPRLDA